MENTKQHLTVDEIKEIIAKEKGYIDWENCINAQPNYNVEHLMDEVLLRFASTQTLPLLEEIAKLKEEKEKLDVYIESFKSSAQKVVNELNEKNKNQRANLELYEIHLAFANNELNGIKKEHSELKDEYSALLNQRIQYDTDLYKLTTKYKKHLDELEHSLSLSKKENEELKDKLRKNDVAKVWAEGAEDNNHRNVYYENKKQHSEILKLKAELNIYKEIVEPKYNEEAKLNIQLQSELTSVKEQLADANQLVADLKEAMIKGNDLARKLSFDDKPSEYDILKEQNKKMAEALEKVANYRTNKTTAVELEKMAKDILLTHKQQTKD